MFNIPDFSFKNSCLRRNERREPLPGASTVRSAAYLSSSGVGVDGDLAGAPAMAVHRGGHLLPREEGDDLLLGRDVLSALGLL